MKLVFGEGISFTFILLFIFISHHETTCTSFYDLLEVKKQASLKEIKESYRHLAKKWHSDLNKNKKTASEKLNLLNEAYKTLSDPHLRSMYDLFGKGSSELDFFLTGDHLIEGESFQLPLSNLPTLTELPPATNKLYDYFIKQQSHKQVQLLLACRDDVEDEWVTWANKLSLDGVKTYHIDSIEENILLRRLRHPSKHESCMGVLVDGKVSWSCPIATSFQQMHLFVVLSFPPHLAPMINNSTFNSFLEATREEKNHVSMVLFGATSPNPSLPFLSALFSTRTHITGAYVYYSLDSRSLFERFELPHNTTSLLVFKENTQMPVFKFSLPHINSQHYRSIMKVHPTLHTPRLSCPHLFDLLCPINTPHTFKSFCVLLLRDGDDSSNDDFLNSFRLYSQDYQYKDRVKFGHVSTKTQKTFVHLLTWGKSPYNASLDSLMVVILWRKEGTTTLNFEALEGGWMRKGGGLARSRRRLTQSLNWLLKHPNTLPNLVEMRVPLRDEHLPKIWIRIGYRFLKWLEILVDFFLGVEDSTYMLLCKSTLVMVAGGAVIGYLHQREMRLLQEKEQASTGATRPHKNKLGAKDAVPGAKETPFERPVIQVYVMSGCNYADLVLRSPADVRLILLLVDSASKTTLANYFGSFLHPYARSKAFRFALVDLDRHFQWYREVLELTLKQSAHYHKLKHSFDNINAKNCLGTVLAINGMKKYYYMYHISYYKAFPASKHKSSDAEESDDEDDYGDENDNPAFEEMTFGMTNLKRRKVGNTNADEDTDKEQDKGQDKLLECDLLRGLGRWMERMCQGSLKKFRLSRWPASME